MINKKYNYYLFDWDGTLANTLEVWFSTYQKLFYDYGLETTYDEIYKKAFGDPYGCQKFGIDNYREFNKKLFDLVEVNYYKASLYPHVKKTLKSISMNNYKIAVVSSTPKKLLARALHYHKIDTLINLLVGREDVKEVKPNPQAIKVALSKNFGNKKNTVLIGDSDKDILAGKKCGIDTVLFIPPQSEQYGNSEDYKQLMPTHTIKSISEIIDFIN